MASSNGWIAVHRNLQYSWIWEDKPFSKGQAWIDLIMLANHKDNKFPFGNEIITVERGSFITSEIKLMERWGWSKSKVRNFLSLLENDSMLVKKTDRKKTTLTIVNYSVYQDLQTTEEPIKDQKKTNKRPLKDTNNNENNDNNENNNKNNVQISKADVDTLFEHVWKLYPSKKGKGQVSDAQKRKLFIVGIEELTRAIERYKTELEKESWRKQQNGSTFFNSGYVDYLDANYVPGESKQKQGNKFNNFNQREYDYNQLERELLDIKE